MQNAERNSDNAGMSLIELIVVVLILGIVAGGAFVGLSQSTRMDALSAAGKLESSLELTRMQTLASDTEISLVVRLDDESGYVGELRKKKADGTGDVVLDIIEIGAKNLSISVRNGASLTAIDSTGVTIQYQKSNGAFVSNYEKFVISGIKTKNVVMVKETGRCYTE